MIEEKKEDLKNKEPKEEKITEVPTQKEKAKAEEASKVEAPKAEEVKPVAKEATIKIERPSECAVCQKSIKKLWYYREGKYFCSKGCWKKSKKTDAKPEDKPAK